MGARAYLSFPNAMAHPVFDTGSANVPVELAPGTWLIVPPEGTELPTGSGPGVIVLASSAHQAETIVKSATTTKTVSTSKGATSATKVLQSTTKTIVAKAANNTIWLGKRAETLKGSNRPPVAGEPFALLPDPIKRKRITDAAKAGRLNPEAKEAARYWRLEDIGTNLHSVQARSIPPRPVVLGRVPTVEIRSESHGHSYKYVDVHQFGPLLKLVVTRQASATVSWSGSEDAPSVSFNPSNGDISVASRGLFVTDPGVLNRFAKSWTNARSQVSDTVFGLEHEFSSPAIAQPVDVSVGGRIQKVTIGAVTNSASIKVEEGAPAFEIATSTGFTVASLSGHQTTVTYTIATTFRIEGQRPNMPLTPEEVEAALAVVAVGAVGVAVIRRARTPRERGGLIQP